MHKNKLIASVAIVAVVAGGIGFYAGMQYGKSGGSPADFRGERAQRFAGAGGPGGAFGGDPSAGGGMMRQGNAGGFVAGEVLSKDDTSITVKLRDPFDRTQGRPEQSRMGDARLTEGQGGSQIVFFSGATQILKSASGAPSDLAQGEQVTVTGTANSDGSITAQSIQIRPPFAASSTRNR